MYLSHKTIQNMHGLSEDERFWHVFDGMKVDQQPVPREILLGLAEAFAEELGVPEDKMDALVLLLEMAAWAAKEPGK